MIKSLILAASVAGLALTGCGDSGFSGTPRVPEAGTSGVSRTLQGEVAFEKLSQYRMLRLVDGKLEPNDGVIPYDLNTPLFSDYALKYRTVWMPEGTSAAYKRDGVFEFPVGTVITKSFMFPADMRQPDEDVYVVETRVITKQENGWIALPYVWDAEQKDAVLKETGAQYEASWIHTDGSQKSTTYLVPDVNQCIECHGNVDPENPEAKKALGLIGLKAKHVNKDTVYGAAGKNQLNVLAEAGYLTGVPDNLADEPQLAAWDDESDDIDRRARALLDANCAHCHNPNGTAAGSTLLLAAEIEDQAALGICNPPIRSIDAERETTYNIDPGDAEKSAMLVRMDSTNPETMMPRLGRSLIFEEGVEVIRQWINQMEDVGCN